MVEPSKQEEREIRDTLRDVFATEFPNPERRGCPENTETKLKALAWRQKFPEAQELISHLGSCSPCYQEHEAFVRQHRSRQKVYRLAAAAVLVIGVGLWISLKLMKAPELILPVPPSIAKVPEPEWSSNQTPNLPKLEPKKPVEVQVAILDLRKRGITRGQNTLKPGDLTLPRGLLKLSIYLPFGSEAGQYEVRISGHKKQVATARGTAVLRNHITVLNVEVNTGAFDTGKYSLSIRQVGWDWYRFPLRLR